MNNRQETDSAVVTFNNQNSILMAMYLRLPQVLCLLHDNRIFAFQKRDGDSSSGEEQTLLLALLTTAKFRLMGFLYSGYHLVDNTLFLLIIILSIMNNNFTFPEHHEIALFAAIGLEGFYDVMLFTHRYWILQRLSIFIGIVLYLLYFTIVGITAVTAIPGHDKNPHISINLVWVVLGTRFCAFILEELVDIAIDMQLHNDLLKLKAEKAARRRAKPAQGRAPGPAPQPDAEPQPLGNDFVVEEHRGSINNLITEDNANASIISRIRKYLNVSNAVEMPPHMEYIGSLFAWGQNSVFDQEAWCVEKIPTIWSLVLCFFPAIPAFFVFIPLATLCIAAALVIACMLVILSFFTCTCSELRRKRYWSELLHI